MKLSLSFLILLIALAAEAGQPSPLYTGSQPTKTEAPNIYEAVVRYQIQSWKLSADSYCIEINGKDADKAFLQRFAPLPVKGRSRCQKRSQKNLFLMSVVDKRTKKLSVIFDLGEINWQGDSEVEVQGGYLCASLCMASGVYHVVRDGSGWHVTRFDWQVMS